MENQPPVSPGSTNEKPVQQDDVVKTPDYEAELKAKDEYILKIQQERDNYRKMGLKYKATAESVETVPLDEERLRQIAREELMNSELVRAQAEKDEFIRKIAKENTEMKIAIQNKAQVSSMPGGSSQSSDTVTIEKLAPEQKAELEAKARELGVDASRFIADAVKNLDKIK